MKHIEPIKKITIVEEAIQKIYEIIHKNNLKEGDRLLPERDLAKLLQISRPSLREAIRALEMVGVIKIKQGSGITIEMTNISDSLLKPLSFALLLNKHMLLELFEVRKIIEVECAGLAAKRATEEEIDKMRSILDLVKNAKDREKAINYELKLHDYIVDAADNLILKQILTSVRDLLRGSRHITVPKSGVSSETITNMERLTMAISSKNSEEARRIMLRHLDSVYKRIM